MKSLVTQATKQLAPVRLPYNFPIYVILLLLLCSCLKTSKSSGDPLVDTAVYEKTLEERDEGWLEGPISFSSLPAGSVLRRRFGLRNLTRFGSSMILVGLPLT